MKEERLLKILLEPHISEKSAAQSGDIRQYAFKVSLDATKTEIKQAVEQIFNVSVRSVRVIKMKSRVVRFGRTMGRQGAWKKAYVSLQAGQEIDIAGAPA